MKKLLFITLVLAALLPVELWAQSTTGGDDGSDAVAAPTFRFDGDYLVIETATEDASIFYQMADLPDMSDETIEKVSSSMTVTANIEQSNYYEQPIELKKSVVLKAIAAGATESEVSVLVYDYDSWYGLLEAIEYGEKVEKDAIDNPNVEENLKEQLKWAIDESKHFYDERAMMPYQEAKHFTNQIYEICKQIEEQMNVQTNAEPYAVLSENNTVLTFYYDGQMKNRSEAIPMDPTGINVTWDNYKADITTVVFDDSFANFTTFTSTSRWFSNCTKLTTITGIENLKTDNVTSMGSMFYGCSKLTNLDVSGFNTANVTSMSAMFLNCNSLTSLDVSNFNTANVGNMERLFYTCKNLTDIDLSNFNTSEVIDMSSMFVGCSSLTSIDISNFNTTKVTRMDGMFGACTGLSAIYVGNGWSTASVTNGTEMFAGCTSLVGGAGTTYDANHVDYTYAHIDGGENNPGYFTDKNAANDSIIQFVDAAVKSLCVQNWDTNGDGELSYKEASVVTNLGSVFRQNKEIASFNELRYFTGLSAISWYAFQECGNLESVELPEGIVEIGYQAFKQCRKLSSFHIPEGVQTIEREAVAYCDSLREAYFPASLTSLLPAFSGCNNITYMDIDPNNTVYYSPTGSNAIINRATNELVEGCNVTVIPDGVTAIGASAFASHDQFETLAIPNTVKSIGRYAFYCGGLKSIELPEGMTTIDYGAFLQCWKLSKVSMPSTLTTISDEAFYLCPLDTIHIPASVTSIGEDAFMIFGSVDPPLVVISEIMSPMEIPGNAFAEATYSNTPLLVHYNVIDAYRNTQAWNLFKNIQSIEKEPEEIATFDGRVLTVNGSTVIQDALEQFGGREEVAKTITAIVWNSSVPLTNSDLQGFDNPNMLIYVNDESLAPQNRDNVVIGDLAKNIVLNDVSEGNGNFYCPKAFKAEMISYTHEYRQQTEIGVARGWETIALPFTVQTIMHEKQGRIVPFGNSESGANFWLRQMTSNGLQRATKIEANVPYIISMPNNEAYYAQYNLAGRVTFSSQDALVPMTQYTPVHMQVEGGMLMFMPCFQTTQTGNMIYALNVGEARGNYPEGSVFEANYRDVRPFEAFTVHEGNGPAPQFIPVFDLNEAGFTGIEDVRSQMSDGRGDNWYDLNGRRLQGEPAQKGVYIKNGRKQVVK